MTTDYGSAWAWMQKQPFFQKLPSEDEKLITIKVVDFKRIATAAYKGGYDRSKL